MTSSPSCGRQRSALGLNEEHNLEWTAVLAPLEEREFIIKWTVEHSPFETIEYNEKF